MRSEKPQVYVDLIVSGEELRSAITPARFDSEYIETWAKKAVAADEWREKLQDRLLRPAWNALLTAMGSGDLGSPASYRLQLSVEPHEK